MTEARLEAVARLERECFTDPWSVEALRSELVNPLSVFNVALIGEEVAGYAGMHDVAGEGYITNIAVGEAFRRMGVATALMDHFFEYAHTHKLKLITLEVRPSNASAISLYNKYGFVEVGRRREFYTRPREDALILTRAF
jgi:ribosomal-protein-alanine N-acetyltransferase